MVNSLANGTCCSLLPLTCVPGRIRVGSVNTHVHIYSTYKSLSLYTADQTILVLNMVPEPVQQKNITMASLLLLLL